MFDPVLPSADLATPLVARLRETISWASTRDFYRRKWRGVAIAPSAIDLETFASVPLTTRAELRRFQSSEHESRDCRSLAVHEAAEETLPIRITRSSGSSGAPLWRCDTRASWSHLRRASAHAFEISSVGARDRAALLVRFGSSLG
ncbi:MAG TPA: hypothetical protein VK116_01355, partial [Planctomycetota bacterium]|nr:hypothetical protein [Planctomycetota bacterium]